MLDMHASACRNQAVRTTVELSAAHRAKLLRLAADRGEKGFSRFIAEALDAYLENCGVADDRESVRRLRGILSEADASEFERRVHLVRESWR
jgi:hypothetical protein